MDLSTFDFSAAPADAKTYGTDWIVRPAPIVFKSGDYPDKNFSMGKDELKLCISQIRTKPIELKVEHKDSIFDGKLGFLIRSDYLDGDPQATMSGKVMIPRWLHDLYADKPLPLSVSWDRTTRMPAHVGLVTDPRVDGAAAIPDVEAAFAKNKKVNGETSFDGHRTEHGQSALQQIHDISAHHGSLCKMPAEVEKTDAGENVASSKKEDALGKMAKMSLEDPDDFLAVAQAMFMHGSERGALQVIHDAASKVGAKCNFQPVKPGENNMPLKTGTPANATSTDPSGQKGYQFSNDPEIKKLQEELAEQKKITEEIRKDKVKAEAATFAATEIADHRAFPNEKQALVDIYTLAADADHAIGGTVDFSGGKTTRVSALVASHKARTPHPLAKETIGTGQAVQVLLNTNQQSNGSQTDPNLANMSKDRRAELLGATPLGQTVLRVEQDERNGNGKN